MTRESLFTLDELCTRAALALSVSYDGAPNDRVRDVPDRRTVRYYTTLGLVDRPVVQGRTGLYGRWQLLQLVAIKRLQSRGESLHAIQQRLPTMSEDELETVAQLPRDEEPRRGPPEPTPRRNAFWKEPPSAVAAPMEDPGPTVLQGLPLSGNVMLLAPLRRMPDDADLDALRVAAAPLLHLLEVRRLIGSPTPPGDDS